jgi:hypothetical protein
MHRATSVSAAPARRQSGTAELDVCAIDIIIGPLP